MPIALFTVFEYLPWSSLLAWMTGLLVAVYFVTASDAGALVIAMITSQGEEEPPLWLRVFWALVCGGVAACLLWVGGLAAVQMAAVIAAFPLAIVMLFICYGVWKALHDETALAASAGLQAAPLIPNEGAFLWRRRLGSIISHPGRQQVTHFIQTTVAKAFDAVVVELEKQDLAAATEKTEEGLCLSVSHGDGVTPFIYEVRPVSQPIPSFALADAGRAQSGQDRYYRAEVFLAQGSRGYDISGYDTEQVIADVINHYDRFRHYLSLTARPAMTS